MAEPLIPANDFVAKWLDRFPEWQIAATFLPSYGRQVQLDYLALQNEWLLAAALPDETPRTAKLSWWAEELRGWSRGMRRHPLGQSLYAASQSWTPLADTLVDMPVDPHAFARALVGADADVLGAAPDPVWLGQLWSAEQALLSSGAAALNFKLNTQGKVPRLRSIQGALLQSRLQQRDAALPIKPYRAVLISWNAARKSK